MGETEERGASGGPGEPARQERSGRTCAAIDELSCLALFDDNPLMLFIIDRQGIIHAANSSGARQLGYTADELIGRPLLHIFHEDDREEVWRRLDISFRSPGEEVSSWECRKVRKDGSVLWVKEFSRPLRDLNGELIDYIACEDITERKRAEDRLRLAMALSERLNTINALIHSTHDFEEIMRRAVDESGIAVSADAVTIALLEDSSFVIRYGYRVPGEFIGYRVDPEHLKGARYVVAVRDIVVFNDAYNDQRLYQEGIRRFGIRSLLIAPLVSRDTVFGVISFYSVTPFFFTEEHVDFARKLSAALALALENSRLFSEVRHAQERATLFAAAVEDSSHPYVALNSDCSFKLFNRAYVALTGYSAEELSSMTMYDITPPEYYAAEAERLEELRRTGAPQLFQKEYIRKDGSRVPIELKAHITCDERGAVCYYYAFVTDITERKRAEEALRWSEERFRMVAEAARALIYEVEGETGSVIILRGLEELLGYRPEEVSPTRDWWEGIMHPDDLPAFRSMARETMASGRDYSVEYRMRHRSGSYITVQDTGKVIRNAAGRAVRLVGGVIDITERKRMEEQIRHMAHHDPLTDLPNRRLFTDIAQVELAQAHRNRQKAAILFLDLDRFKEVNDTLGHEAGDELLKAVAARLRASVRKSDTISRIGGDEFNIILADIPHVEDISAIARKIMDSFRTVFIVAGHELYMTTSVGISIYPDDAEDMDTLLRYADIALYYAKDQGKNTFQFFNPAINIRSLERMRLEHSLRQTIERGGLMLYYQPQIDMKTGAIVAAEALVRWQHPEMGLLDPLRFIPLAEETGLITALDEWVLRTACGQVRAWMDAGLPLTCVTVNLSARQFLSPDLARKVAEAVSAARMPTECLYLEIPERVAMGNLDATAARLKELAAMGICISIDDFGTGFSSLSHLKRLPIGKIKIDRSFVKDLATDLDDRAIISAMTAMAHNMKLGVVAEGVETAEQLSFLRATQCDEAQGYLISRPLSAEEFGELIREGRE